MPKIALFRTSLHVLCAALLTALCLTALITPSTARADEVDDEDALHDPVVVPIQDDPMIEDP